MQKEIHNDTLAFYADSREAWRDWLIKNHEHEQAVWLVMYHKNAGVNTITYNDAVEEALCFGWIDSVAHKRDASSKYQYFARRKPKSNWSKLNRQRADKMVGAGLMTPAGQYFIDLAKETGTWLALEDVQNEIIPADLQKAFDGNVEAYKNFMGFPPSSKRIILEWILNAKKPETRIKRVEETVRLAAENVKANHYRK